jgi:2-succinyl-5-enolpyruvyl-6-hydroxy-3-cyclohexene-1-carboxylate synthase
VTPSILLARLAVQALCRAGVRHVILCPGSRSAPLAYALAEADEPAVHVRHDERVAGFTALGVGRDRPGPAGAVVTTSGTAAANLHPAVLEAHSANVPLIVVTADRPPELRGTWTNQTSELQADVFGAAVRARLDLDDATAAADPDAAWSSLLDTLRAAYGRHAGERPGPVHLNLGMSDPLLPATHEQALTAARDGAEPLSHPAEGDVQELGAGGRTLVVAGDGAGRQARELAEAVGLPLLAEPSSGARGGPGLVSVYRLLLELPELSDDVERVVVYGRPTLSRPVTRLLAGPGVELVLVSPYPHWPNPGRVARRVTALTARPAAETWSARWLAAGAAARCALDSALDTPVHGQILTGPLVARELVTAMSPDERLVAGSSNAIRDLDLAMPGIDGPGPVVLANRGLAGIDGTLSTATGLALAAQAPVRALVGDLTFLHDANALLAEPGSQPPQLQVVLLNDAGGGIFSLLEHGARAEEGPAQSQTFERAFGTPHAVDVAALCRAVGVPHVPVADLPALRAALADPVPGTSVVEVALGAAYRQNLRSMHARIRAAVHEAARREIRRV